MNVLVDSSVWIDYFRGEIQSEALDLLIEANQVAINDLILTELLPPLKIRGNRTLVALLGEVVRYPMTIDWKNLVEMQAGCLRRGINKVGIPDLMIAQQAVQNGIALYSHDKHFTLLARHFPLFLFES